MLFFLILRLVNLSVNNANNYCFHYKLDVLEAHTSEISRILYLEERGIIITSSKDKTIKVNLNHFLGVKP